MPMPMTWAKPKPCAHPWPGPLCGTPVPFCGPGPLACSHLGLLDALATGAPWDPLGTWAPYGPLGSPGVPWVPLGEGERERWEGKVGGKGGRKGGRERWEGNLVIGPLVTKHRL